MSWNQKKTNSRERRKEKEETNIGQIVSLVGHFVAFFCMFCSMLSGALGLTLGQRLAEEAQPVAVQDVGNGLVVVTPAAE
jgi:hypothetical protein